MEIGLAIVSAISYSKLICNHDDIVICYEVSPFQRVYTAAEYHVLALFLQKNNPWPPTVLILAVALSYAY